MDYTLKQLSVFMTVAKLESTTAAARELSLSQSAVSSAIQQLESQIGQKLFDRIGRQLKLNRVGASLLPAVTELLAHAERLNLQLKGETIAGTVCIGASYTIANHIIVDTMVDFQKEHANVDIEINSDNSPGIIDSVIEGNVDFGLIESSVDDPRVLVEAWLQDELVVFASPDHPLVRQGRASVLELERAAWVLRELGPVREVYLMTPSEEHWLVFKSPWSSVITSRLNGLLPKVWAWVASPLVSWSVN